MKLWILADRFFDNSVKWAGKKKEKKERPRARDGEREREPGRKETNKGGRFDQNLEGPGGVGNREEKKCNLQETFGTYERTVSDKFSAVPARGRSKTNPRFIRRFYECKVISELD